jgi:hypothetical protein
MVEFYTPFLDLPRRREIERRIIDEGPTALDAFVRTGEVVLPETLDYVLERFPQLETVEISHDYFPQTTLKMKPGILFHHYGNVPNVNGGGPFKVILQQFSISMGLSNIKQVIYLKCEGWRQKNCRRLDRHYHPFQNGGRLHSHINLHNNIRQEFEEIKTRRDFLAAVELIISKATRYEPEDAMCGHRIHYAPFILMHNGTYDATKNYTEISPGEYTVC